MEKRPGERNVNSKILVQLEEDRDDSARQSWMMVAAITYTVEI